MWPYLWLSRLCILWLWIWSSQGMSWRSKAEKMGSQSLSEKNWLKTRKKNVRGFIGDEILPPRELTYPTLGRGKSSSNMPYQGDMLIPWRVILPGHHIERCRKDKYISFLFDFHLELGDKNRILPAWYFWEANNGNGENMLCPEPPNDRTFWNG